MKIFQFDEGDKKSTFEAKSIAGQKRGTRQVKNAYTRSDSVSSAPALPTKLSLISSLRPAVPKSCTLFERNEPRKLFVASTGKVTLPARRSRAREMLVFEKTEVHERF